MPSPGGIPPLNFSLKVASRCNLDCDYCYIYSGADDSWRKRPAVMPDATVFKAVDRIREHCLRSRQRTVEITFHGGEPFLVRGDKVRRWCDHARRALSDIVDVRFSVQTNATLVDEAWIETLREHAITVGVSLDGPRRINDAHRVDRRGGGSYERVVEGLRSLSSAGIRLGALAVVQPSVDGLAVYNELKRLDFRYFNFLLPHHTHEQMPEIWRVHGPTPCADYLMPILDEWWATGTMQQEVGLFLQMCKVVLGGRSATDQIGNRLLSFVFVETDGSIEGLDTLKMAANRVSVTELNVFRNNFADIQAQGGLHARAIFDGVPLPTGCSGCPEALTCAGGHLGDRYSETNQFDNRSVWCRDLQLLFDRTRSYLEVSPEETQMRRLQGTSRIGGLEPVAP